MTRIAAALGALILLSVPAQAESVQVIDDRNAFLRLIENRQLTRFGITLRVSPEGVIEGSAFGRRVTGAWNWNGSYFCRDLNFGNENLGPNCQVVQLRGETLRFIADEGRGEYADLRIR